MPKGRVGVKLDRLRELESRPDQQAAYAAELLGQESNAELVQAALAVLEAQPATSLRPLLLRKYHFFDTGGGRDSGCYVRAAIVRILRPIARAEDCSLLERAASTYEFLPPTRSEMAADLRAAALLTIEHLDPLLAGYHAVRLLWDPHMSSMSGEPSVTAARVLAAQGQLLPLYGYAMQGAPAGAEVTAECLRSLATLPASLLPALVERYRTSADEIVLLGLFDLLLAHGDRAAYTELVLEFLRTTTLYNIYRYLASTIVAARHKELIPALEALAAKESNPRKVALLQEALALR